MGLGGTRYIQSFRTRVLSESQVSEICAAIEAGRLKPSWGTNRQHVSELEAAQGGTSTGTVSTVRSNDGIANSKTGTRDGESSLGM